MRQVRTHAYKAPAAGVWITEEETAALVGLPAWYWGLWVQLLLRSNFKTGAGTTGYGELINALTPDQPERGPRLWAPSRDDVKTALRRLEALRLMAVDAMRSEQLQRIEFLLRPRVASGVSAEKLPRELSPGSHLGKRSKLTPGKGPGLSAVNTLSPTPCGQQLSTGAAPSEAVRQKLEEVTQRVRGGGRTRAPKGA